MNKNSAYLRFIELCHAIDSAQTTPQLDLMAYRLLDSIAIAHNKNTPMTVTEAMSLTSIASPATLHRKLDALRESDLIETVFDATNRRTKFIVLTKSAHKRYEDLGHQLIHALSQK